MDKQNTYPTDINSVIKSNEINHREVCNNFFRFPKEETFCNICDICLYLNRMPESYRSLHCPVSVKYLSYSEIRILEESLREKRNDLRGENE